MNMYEMIKPLNDQERKVAISKFIVVSIITLLLIPCIALIYNQVPEIIAQNPAISPATTFTHQEMASDVQQKLETAIQEQSNINITLLIDATPGMETFIPAVADAAEAINQSYQLSMTTACYRDASEGQWLYLSSDMTGQAPAEWLRNLSTSIRYDQDEPEAVYYALKKTMESEHLKRGESNILVLIGDAGNHAQEAVTRIAPSAIVDLLVEKNCYFAAIQARNPASDPAFDLFPEQIKNEIMLPALQAYQVEKEDDLLHQQDREKGASFYGEGSCPYYLYAAHQNEALSPEELKNEIVNYVDRAIRSVYHKIKMAQDLQKGKAISETDKIYKSLLPILKVYGINKEDLNSLQAK